MKRSQDFSASLLLFFVLEEIELSVTAASKGYVSIPRSGPVVEPPEAVTSGTL